MSDTAEGRPTNVWIFHGAGANFASGVFTDRDQGLAWIVRHCLTGILTEYPVGDGCYDIALKAGHFTPSRDHHGTPAHVATFSPGYTDHVHVRDGAIDDRYGEVQASLRYCPHPARGGPIHRHRRPPFVRKQ